jgi:hypothetical protein
LHKRTGAASLMTPTPAGDDDLATANRGRRDAATWLEDSPEFDEFVMTCLDAAVELLDLLGAKAGDAAAAVDDALAAIRTADHVGAMPTADAMSLPFLSALSLTLWLRTQLLEARLRRQWYAAPSGREDPPFDPADALRAVLCRMGADQQETVVAVYRGLPYHTIVALLEVPKLQACTRLAQLWSASPVPGRVGQAGSGHVVG